MKYEKLFSNMSYYCSLCYQPLHGAEKTCPTCGQKTTPIDIFKKLELDDSFTKREKTELSFSSMMIFGAVLIELFICVFAVLFMTGIIGKDPHEITAEEYHAHMLEDMTFEERKLYEKTQLAREQVREYWDSAPDEWDFHEFLMEYNIRGTEDVEFYHAIWNQEGVSRYVDTHPVEISGGSSSNGTELVWDKAKYVAIPLLIMFSVFQAFAIILLIPVLMKKQAAIQTMLSFVAEIDLYLMLVTGNIISFGMMYYGIVQISRLTQKAESGNVHNLSGKIQRRLRVANEHGEWECHYCSYINGVNDSVCRSCGRDR